eukprot:scaffold117472_cov36-Phaeocystis_antarctica.AAC.1
MKSTPPPLQHTPCNQPGTGPPLVARRRGVDPNSDPNPDPNPNPNPNPDPNQAPYVVAATMLTLFFSVLLAETPLQNSVSLTADLTNGEAKTYKLLLDIDVR